MTFFLKREPTLPELKIVSFDGTKTILTKLREADKYLVIDFWGHWCGPCVETMPRLVEFHQKWKDRVTLVGVHNGEKADAIELLKKHNAIWPQFESNKELENVLFIDRWPTYVLVDPSGAVINFRATLVDIKKIMEKTRNPK